MPIHDTTFENHRQQTAVPILTHAKSTRPNAHPKGPWRLLTTRRFAPFFWTQFLGAFNDNVFKNALMLIIAFQAGQRLFMASDMVINLAAGLFILPFFLFSATAGQLADKMEKSLLIRTIKCMEIIIMTAAAIALWTDSLWLLLVLLFLMGTQSAFFGPIKYSIMPEHLKETEIVGGNALVETGTFLAILLGTLCGGLLVQLQNGPAITGAVLVAIAIGGWIASRNIPVTRIAAPGLTIRWNVLHETLRTIGHARRERTVFLSILGISWFWLLGAAYLTQLPNFTRQVLGGGEGVVTLLLTLFSIGVGGGSLLCERLSHGKVELGVVPLGAIGLSVFGIDLFWACRLPEVAELMTAAEFLSVPGASRLMLDFVMIGVSGGLYIVPLFAMIQMRTRRQQRARIFAANNILNALFMVFAAMASAIALGVVGVPIPVFLLGLALINGGVAVIIFSLVPDSAMRFLVWMFTHIMYRFRDQDLDRIPPTGAAVLVCNHVSYMDALLIIGACRRPVRFVIFEPIYRMPLLHFVFRAARAIPIASQRCNPGGLKKAFNEIASALDQGDVVCIFPEGHLTRDGHVDVFRPGIERIVNRNPVPVVPLALRGLWGSFFSHKHGKAMTCRPQRFWSRIELVAGWPVMPAMVSADGLRHAVVDLRGDRP